jgi:hypothetical protein
MVALALTVAALASMASARAGTASCGGLSPLETSCRVTIRMSGRTLRTTFSAGVVFAGTLEITATSGSKSAYLGPCAVVSGAAPECDGVRVGAFRKGDRVKLVARVIPDPVLNLPLGVGEWSLTASG